MSPQTRKRPVESVDSSHGLRHKRRARDTPNDESVHALQRMKGAVHGERRDLAADAGHGPISSAPFEDDILEAAETLLSIFKESWTTIGGDEGDADSEPAESNIGHSSDAIVKPLIPIPPGYKISTRQPKPGEPPLWGLFTNSQEPITTPRLQRIRHTVQKPLQSHTSVPAAIPKALMLVMDDPRIGPLKSTSANAENTRPVPPPPPPPRGGTLMSSVKEHNQSKKQTQDQRLVMKPIHPAQMYFDPAMASSHQADYAVGMGWLPGRYLSGSIR